MNHFSALVLVAFMICCARSQYSAPSPYNSATYAPQPVNDNYVCTYNAHYELIGQFGKHYRGTTNFCQDAYKTGSCEKCCRMAARIQGTKVEEKQIIGFNIVIKREPLCVCCSPTSA